MTTNNAESVLPGIRDVNLGAFSFPREKMQEPPIKKLEQAMSAVQQDPSTSIVELISLRVRILTSSLTKAPITRSAPI